MWKGVSQRLSRWPELGFPGRLGSQPADALLAASPNQQTQSLRYCGALGSRSAAPRRLTPQSIKPVLDEAMDRYPVLLENCLRWREQLFHLHDIHRLLDMLQDQADGKPIPPGYLKPAAPAKTARQ